MVIPVYLTQVGVNAYDSIIGHNANVQTWCYCMIISNYLSLWEVAHRWHNVDPNKTDSGDLPLTVQDTLRALCSALLNSGLNLYLLEAISATEEQSRYNKNEIIAIHVPELPPAIERCAFKREYDKPDLDTYCIFRHDLFEYSIHANTVFPAFWEDEKLITDMGGVFVDALPKEQKPPRPNSSLFDQSLCQAIAKTLWDIHPNMTIEAMTKHPSILKYGNGALYKGKNTLRDWLSPVAPEHVKKRGRPRTSKPSNEVA